jgi:hypothetical protein
MKLAAQAFALIWQGVICTWRGRTHGFLKGEARPSPQKWGENGLAA